MNLEDRLGVGIPCHHPIVAWILEYNAILLTKYQPGIDGLTAYERFRGQPAREKLPEFGETIL